MWDTSVMILWCKKKSEVQQTYHRKYGYLNLHWNKEKKNEKLYGKYGIRNLIYFSIFVDLSLIINRKYKNKTEK